MSRANGRAVASFAAAKGKSSAAREVPLRISNLVLHAFLSTCYFLNIHSVFHFYGKLVFVNIKIISKRLMNNFLLSVVRFVIIILNHEFTKKFY